MSITNLPITKDLVKEMSGYLEQEADKVINNNLVSEHMLSRWLTRFFERKLGEEIK